MSVTLASPAPLTETADQCFVIGGIPWDAYVSISDALNDRGGVRMICETYEQVARSMFLTMLNPSDVVDQIRRAQ